MLNVATHRVTVVLGVALTLAGVAAHALFLTGPAATYYQGYAATVVAATVALVCAAADLYYTTASAAILAGPALRVAFAAAPHHAAPLDVLASPVIFADAGVCFSFSLVLAFPLVTAAVQEAPTCARRLGVAAAGLLTAVMVALLVATTAGHSLLQTPAVGSAFRWGSDVCAGAAVASLQQQLALVLIGVAVPLVVAVASKVTAAPATAATATRLATIVSALCIALRTNDGWVEFRSGCAATPSELLSSTPFVHAQLLRLGTVTVVLPLMLASLCAILDVGAKEFLPDDDDNDGTGACAVDVV